MIRSLFRKIFPPRAARALSGGQRRLTRSLPGGRVDWGSLRRLEPVSADWGFDRGQPVDRHYMECFLEGQKEWIRGRVLEIDTNDYTRRFGGSRVEQSDVLHLSEKKPGITFVGDIATADHLPSDAFDCVLITQTLNLVYDVRSAVATIHRVLKPGGVCLATIPGLTKNLRDEEGATWGHCWGMTSFSARKLFCEYFEENDVHVEGAGNVLSAVAFLYGLATEELSQEELRHRDGDFELLVNVRAIKGERSA